MAEECVRSWYDEISAYNFEDAGLSEENSRFTQVVWADSKKLGVGFATGGFNDMYAFYCVAHYQPTGNVVGRFKQNVKPAIDYDSEGSSKNSSILVTGVNFEIGVGVESDDTTNHTYSNSEYVGNTTLVTVGEPKEDLDMDMNKIFKCLIKINKYFIQEGKANKVTPMLTTKLQQFSLELLEKTTENDEEEHTTEVAEEETTEVVEDTTEVEEESASSVDEEISEDVEEETAEVVEEETAEDVEEETTEVSDEETTEVVEDTTQVEEEETTEEVLNEADEEEYDITEISKCLTRINSYVHSKLNAQTANILHINLEDQTSLSHVNISVNQLPNWSEDIISEVADLTKEHEDNLLEMNMFSVHSSREEED